MKETLKITLINRSSDSNFPKIFLFKHPVIPTFDQLKEKEPWRVIEQLDGGNITDISIPRDSNPESKLCLGLARHVALGENLNPNDIISLDVFEHVLDNKSNLVLGIEGNAQDGYQFKIDDWR